jgi:hypothetical protein
MRGRQRVSSIVEMPRNAEVERLAPEQQMASRQRGHGTHEDTVRNPTEQRNLGTLVYRIRFKWKSH